MRLQNLKTVLSLGFIGFLVSACSSLGIEGKGDGELSAELISQPANLTFTQKLPIATDAFYLWTISKGNERFDSAMPRFKDSLDKQDI